MKMLHELLAALDLEIDTVQLRNIDMSSSEFCSNDIFAVSDLAAYSMLSAALALRQYAGLHHTASIKIDKSLAYFWFHQSVEPIGWDMSPVWDDLAGDYPAQNGFVRLHTNAAHHKSAAILALGAKSRAQIAAIIAKMEAVNVENKLVSANGAASMMMSCDQWAKHPQGLVVASEPLIAKHLSETAVTSPPMARKRNQSRPLTGIKVLDLTRIIAGPVATRFLAAYGADVLRIDPPGWSEGDYIVDLNIGKRCATLDLQTPLGKAKLRELITQADILVHGYRTDALDRIGLGASERRKLNIALIDVALNAYGWQGPWKNRRGFDSLVQMSAGIADFGMRSTGHDQPRPLSVQALDHATGYLMAASAIRGLSYLRDNGYGSSWRLSLAATADFLKNFQYAQFAKLTRPIERSDYQIAIEHTDLGPVQRLKWPIKIDDMDQSWDQPATRLHQADPLFH